MSPRGLMRAGALGGGILASAAVAASLLSGEAPPSPPAPSSPSVTTADPKVDAIVRKAVSSLVKIDGLDLIGREHHACQGAILDPKTVVMPVGCLGKGPFIHRIEQSNDADQPLENLVFLLEDSYFMGAENQGFSTVFVDQDEHHPISLGPELYRIGFNSDQTGVMVVLFTNDRFPPEKSVTLASPVEAEEESSFTVLQDYDAPHGNKWYWSNPSSISKTRDGKLTFSIEEDKLEDDTTMGLINNRGELVTLTNKLAVPTIDGIRIMDVPPLGKGTPFIAAEIKATIDKLKAATPPYKSKKIKKP